MATQAVRDMDLLPEQIKAICAGRQLSKELTDKILHYAKYYETLRKRQSLLHFLDVASFYEDTEEAAKILLKALKAGKTGFGNYFYSTQKDAYIRRAQANMPHHCQLLKYEFFSGDTSTSINFGKRHFSHLLEDRP